MIKIKRIINLLHIVLEVIFFRKKVFLVGIPIHGNLGDQAIAIAEQKLFNDKFPKYKVINIETIFLIKFKTLFKILIKNNTIFYTGGGFLGSLWLNEEEMFEFILENYHNNKIIVLPQTIFFSDDQESTNILNEAKKAYSNKNIHIFAREKHTYKFVKENFNTKVTLAPDMVLYLDKLEDIKERKDVLFCIRKDKEKIEYNYSEIEKIIKSKLLGNIDYSDTVLEKTILVNKRQQYVYDKIKEFSKYKLIITDRLHGMIFSYLANTPCIVLENKSYKIQGVYEWIQDCEYIKLSDMNQLNNNINKVLQSNRNYNFNKEKYNTLINSIKEVI